MLSKKNTTGGTGDRSMPVEENMFKAELKENKELKEKH